MVFYIPGETSHGLPHNPFKALVVPRPIGWISTLNEDGTANLAPYSHFNVCGAEDPPYVMFSASQKAGGGKKDSTINAEREGEFCWSLTSFDLSDAMNITAEAVPHGVDEFELAGLTKGQGQQVKVPYVLESPIRFECKYHQTIALPNKDGSDGVYMVIGRVVGVHIEDRVLTDGAVDVSKTQPIGRLGPNQYVAVKEFFKMIVPGNGNRPSSLAVKAAAP